MDRRDTEIDRLLRICEDYRLAIDQDFALVRLVNAGEDLDERRLSRTIFADQRRHPAREQRDIDIVQRLDAGKRLGDATHLQKRRL